MTCVISGWSPATSSRWILKGQESKNERKWKGQNPKPQRQQSGLWRAEYLADKKLARCIVPQDTAEDTSAIKKMQKIRD